ncbi:MAG: protein kinase domain-containing protein [Actinomycetes bacterium]
MTPDADVLLGGRYKLTSRIAAGGMGEVWAATDEVLGRNVAIKILRREYADDPTFLERFRAEARHTAALSHAGIAAVFDYSNGAPSSADGAGHAPYLVMERIDGEPLSRTIAREGALGQQRSFDIVAQAALALQTAHDHGVIHRDVKPGNILVTPDGTVKITDFGISRATNSVPLTQTGTIMGTAYYISPEQASGQSVTPASDIYSLGVVAYECLSGRRPFAGDTPVSVALAQVREEPPALGLDVSPEVSDLVMRMLAKDPEQRPASAGELAEQARRLSRSAAAAAPVAATAALPAFDDPEATQALGPRSGGGPASLGADGAERETPPRGSGAAAGSRLGTDTDPGFQLPAPQRTPHWLPYAAGLAVGALALLLVVRACTNDATTPTAATAPTTASSQPSATPTPPQEAIRVRASDYLGQPVSSARGALRTLGLHVSLRPVRASGDTAVGTVTGVDPTGRLSPDVTVTLEYAQAAAGTGHTGKAKKKKDGKQDKRGIGIGNGQDQEVSEE